MPDAGLSAHAVPALVVGRVGDETCDIAASVCQTGRFSVVKHTRTRIVGLHEAERPVVDGDGEEAEVVRVADA